MKDGFYLSPDGKTIVNIRTNNFQGYVEGMTRRVYWTQSFNKQNITRLFGSWIRLK